MSILIRFRYLLTIILVFGLLVGCGGGGGDTSTDADNGNGEDPGNNEPIRTVSLELGEKRSFEAVEVDTDGSLLTLDLPGDVLDGLQIGIPNSSYDGTVNVALSYSPINSHSGNEFFEPVTPLITVENGGGYANQIMTLKIPVTIEDGYHYMAFYYDKTTGALEGIPEVDHDSTSLTIATRHFSDIVINRRIYKLFFGDDTIKTGFKVKQDNWPFENPVTHLSAGICSGMSIASLYYYNEKKKKQAYPPLFSFYDKGTSDFDIDDDQAIKLSSIIQWWDDNNGPNGIDTDDYLWTYFQFIHSLLVSGEPQFVSIYPPGGEIGHAMVVYKKSGNDLYVYDPNLPEDQDVKIEFEWSNDPLTTEPKQLTGSFKPFESQWNNGSEKVNFTDVRYTGKTALIDLEYADLWNQLDNESVPWNKSIYTSLDDDYPEYELKIIEKDDTGTERESDLIDNYETTNSVIKIKHLDFLSDTSERITAYSNGSTTAKTNGTQTIDITLNPGANNIGLLLETKKYFKDVKKTLWAWTDFKYYNIHHKDPTQTVRSCPKTYDSSLDQDNNIYNLYFYSADRKYHNYCRYREFGLFSEESYFNNLLHGLFKTYHENGKIFRENAYKKGKLHGEAKSFRSSGEMYYCGVYINGEYIKSCMP